MTMVMFIQESLVGQSYVSMDRALGSGFKSQAGPSINILKVLNSGFAIHILNFVVFVKRGDKPFTSLHINL